MAASDRVRRDAKQFAKGIFSGADVTTGIDNLRLYIQVGRFHLVDGSRVGLAVLIECLLGVERGVPETVGLREDYHLAVEQHKHIILPGDGADEVRLYSLFAELGL